jgi:nicotinate-nucleotide pyrophosphorylase (carboxylating)
VTDTSSFDEIIARALAEDLGELGDITSRAVIAPDATSRANLVVRAGGVVAGLPVARRVFEHVDRAIEFEVLVSDGDSVEPGEVLAIVSGPSRSILTAERTALNLLGRMSGVATATAALVSAVEGTRARVTDTRKTMPGLRVADKYAVVAGGGVNHRMGLYDELMIKDNHIVAAGDLRSAVAAARRLVGEGVRVTVEVEDLEQLAEALVTDADRVLLDNMSPDELRRAVEMVGDVMETEASGGITLETVRAVAETGVGYISVGWITHSAPQLDIALDFV